MRFNWGHGIALFYTTFAVSMITMAVKTTNYDHSLVVDNYYEEDLRYQQQIDKQTAAAALLQPLEWHYDHRADQLELQFPTGLGRIAATLHLYRPSDKRLDRRLPLLVPPDGRVRVSAADWQAGRWKLNLEWEADGVRYYHAKTVDRRL